MRTRSHRPRWEHDGRRSAPSPALRVNEPAPQRRDGARHPAVARAEEIASAIETTCLRHVDGRNLVGRHLRQSCREIRHVPPSDDVVIVCHHAGGSAVERWYDQSVAAVLSEPGRITIVPNGRPSAWRLPEPVDVFQLYIPGSTIRQTAEREFEVDPNRVEIIDSLSEDDRVGAAFADAVVLSIHEGAERDDLFLDALGEAVAVHLLRRHAVLPRTARRLGERPGALSAERLHRLSDFIEDRLGDDLKLEDLAEAACLSTFHLSRCFRQTTGLTLHAYVMLRRVERAQALLADRKLTLADIAYRCGFASQSHFTAAFKKRTGSTPGHHRRVRLS